MDSATVGRLKMMFPLNVDGEHGFRLHRSVLAIRPLILKAMILLNSQPDSDLIAKARIEEE